MPIDITNLEREVTEDEQVKSSAATLLTRLKSLLDAAVAEAGNLPALQARINEISTMLSDRTDALSTAVAANTPSEPA
jgi:hypothetical protein